MGTSVCSSLFLSSVLRRVMNCCWSGGSRCRDLAAVVTVRHRPESDQGWLQSINTGHRSSETVGPTMSLWEGMLCPRALQGKTSRDIFLQVVTPDRIPQFTIPSLDIHKKHRKGQPVGTAWRRGSDPAAEDDHNVPGSSGRLAATAQAIPDPIAWAALSLPHLPKVTTPYGFVTLGQSPQVTSEEAFFHSASSYSQGPAAETRPCWQEESGCCRPPGVPVAGGGSCTQTGPLRDRKQLSPGHEGGGSSQTYRTPAGLPLPRRRASLLGELQLSKEAEKRERRLLWVSCDRNSSSLELPAGTPRKNLFQRILRRHLAHSRQLEPVNFTLH